MARVTAALVAVAVGAAAALALSGGSSTDPRTPAAIAGLPPPFLTTGVVGEGGLTAGIDSYGDVVDLRAPGPAGEALIDNPLARQRAGTVPARTGIVPRALIGGAPLPFWRADAVHQSYVGGTDVLRTTAFFGSAVRARVECAATAKALGCVSANGPGGGWARVSFAAHVSGKRGRVHLDDRAAWRAVGASVVAGRRWLGGSRPLGRAAPLWARRLYRRSLLVLHALTGARNGAVAAGARDGWAYVWPRDAGAAAIALAAAGHRGDARRVAEFLRRADLGAAARFDGEGGPVPGRAAQGDAFGWAGAAARAAGLPRKAWTALEREARESWRDRADYQEKAPGDYLGNALAASGSGAKRFLLSYGGENVSLRLQREAGDPASGLDAAAAWAVRPFPRPRLFAAVRRALTGLERAQRRRLGPGALHFGLLPSEDWPDTDPWTAPTAWSAWSLAVLSRRDMRPTGTGRAGDLALARHDRADALALLRDLRRAETPAGVLPERVSARTGIPLSTAPLAWSHAFAILALRQLWPGTARRRRHMLGR